MEATRTENCLRNRGKNKERKTDPRDVPFIFLEQYLKPFSQDSWNKPTLRPQDMLYQDAHYYLI